ncbi:MAG TPA: right-handed parallel beta-helix repeat-containing protein [Actinomycetota bacterium]|nr:right-handed parallel beta-helix repeat-containing protein [Actinomycetota bacterium]
MNGERNGLSWHRRALTALLLACAAAASLALRVAPVAAAPQAHPVEVRSNFFEPRVINIAPGDTVTWTAVEFGHTVEADNGRFNFYPQRYIHRGESVSFTFLTEETVRYHCRVHGSSGGGGMSGTIIVGAGSPSPTPTPTPSVTEHRYVPTPEYKTIGAALNGIAPGGVVHLAPGEYRESVAVRTPGVTVQGDGAPSDVVIDGQGLRRTGVLLAAGGTAVRSLTVRGHRAEGIAVRGVTVASVRNVASHGNGSYGVLVADASGVTVEDVAATGHRVAGIAVQGCDECDTVVQDVTVMQNLYGVLLDNAGSVVVRRSTIAANATGIVARSLATGDGTVQRGVHITGNDITGNTTAIPAASATEFAVQSGVWLAGVWFALVDDNRIDGHDYGVLVTSFGVPSLDGRISGNVIGGSAVADLGWDGVGAGMCFSGNAAAGGGALATRPSFAETVYVCGGTRLPGIPEPLVIADLARDAAGG